MKRRVFYISLLVAVLSALACYLLVFHEPPEPGYQGKSFSAWAEIYYQGTSNDVFEGDNWHPQPVRDAENALRQIGTNAIPTLLRMLRAHDAEWKLKVLAVLQKQHLMKFKYVTATGRNLEAEIVFHLLGASASNAVPALIEIFDQKPFGSSQYAAGSALGYIGPPAMAAIPALLRGATNQDPACRGCSVLALGQIHGDPDSVLPVLIQSLKDTNRYVVLAAFRGIGNFGPAARMAVPALLPMVTNSPSWLAVNVLSSLRQIQAAPGVMVPALVTCLGQPDRNLRNSSIDYLGSLGNDAQPALPSLLEMCGDRDVSVKRAALNAVARIDGTNPAVILVLSQALKDEHFEIKMIAASSLGDIGPPAVSAVPELVHAQTNAEPQFWSILAKALKKIDPDGTARAAVK